MKRENLRTLILLVGVLCANAVYSQKAIKITRDCEVKTEAGDTLALFCNSTLEVVESKSYVLITDVVDNFKENYKVGIYKGAELECLDDGTTELRKIKFYDNTRKERYDVPGVRDNLRKVKKFRIQVENTTAYISENDCVMLDEIMDVPNVDSDFSYSPESHCLYISPKEDYKIVVKGSPTQCKNGQKNTIEDVNDNEIITVILSNDSASYLDSYIEVSDLQEYVSEDEIDSTKISEGFPADEELIIFLALMGLALILLLVYYGFFRRKKKKKVDQNTPETFGYNNKSGGDKHNYDDDKKINLDQLQGLISEIKVQTNDIVKRLNSIDTTLCAYKDTIDIDRTLETKESEIVQLTKEKKLIKEQFDALTKKSGEDEKTILELRKALNVTGAIVLNGASDFVNDTGELLKVGRNTEKLIVDFLTQIDGDDSAKFAYFIKQYVSSIDSEKRDRWNSILSTLSIKGYIKDADAIKYLNAKGCESNENKLDWLKKFVYEEFLKDYLSSLIVMLESIKCSKLYGLTQPVKADIQKDIDNLLSVSKKNGITIHYQPLLKDLNDYENIQISTTLPVGVNLFYSCKNKPLLVIKYGVSSEKSTKSSKTEIVQLD